LRERKRNQLSVIGGPLTEEGKGAEKRGKQLSGEKSRGQLQKEKKNMKEKGAKKKILFI